MTLAVAGVVAAAGRAVRGLLVLLGTLVMGVALLVAFVPGAGALVPTAALVDLLGSDYFVVAAVGLAAVGLATLAVLARSLGGVEVATPPVVEAVQSAPRPGERFDRSRRGATGGATGSARERLREAAARTVMRTTDCSRPDAERRVAEGAWTDDRVAARFLASEGTGPTDPLGGVLDGDRRLRRTVDAIAALSDDGSGDRRAVERRGSERRTAAGGTADGDGRTASPRRADGGSPPRTDAASDETPEAGPDDPEGGE